MASSELTTKTIQTCKSRGTHTAIAFLCEPYLTFPSSVARIIVTCVLRERVKESDESKNCVPSDAVIHHYIRRSHVMLGG